MRASVLSVVGNGSTGMIEITVADWAAWAPGLHSREDWLANESHGFLDRVFGGRVAPLVSYFSQHRKLAKDDIDELKRLIRELDDGR